MLVARGQLGRVAPGLDLVADVDRVAVGPHSELLAEASGRKQVLLTARRDVGGVVVGVGDDERVEPNPTVLVPRRGGVGVGVVAGGLEDPLVLEVVDRGRLVACLELDAGAAFPLLVEPADGGEPAGRRELGEVSQQSTRLG